jgi:dTDP-glucose pyrophosphorylase
MTQSTDGAAPNSQDWRKALVAEDATIQDGIRSLNESQLQVALVVDPAGCLLGTVTDGDIRRGLLAGMRLEDPLKAIVFRQPLVVPPEVGRDTVLQLMQANRIHQVPMVDEQRQLVGVHLWDRLLSPSERPNSIVIMAGGRGTRLMPHTESCPKPLLPVGGKPMLQHIIERAKGEGFRRFVLAIHYLGHMIEEHFGDGSAFGVEISYLREEGPLGTAGALSLLDRHPSEPMLVTNGDVLTDIRYGELLDYHLRHGAAATMTVRLHEWQQPYGVVLTRGLDIVGFEEKPVSRSHINAGVYVLNPTALTYLRPGERCDMPTLFGRVRDRGERTIVYPLHEPWLDVGRASDLAQAQETRK